MKSAPVLPGFFDQGVAPDPIRSKAVRETSRAAYQAEHGHLEGRARDVMLNLGVFMKEYDESPTSAELAGWIRAFDLLDEPLDWMSTLLWVRRGLSDLLAKGAVENPGKRTCAVTGKVCLTWRIKTR